MKGFVWLTLLPYIAAVVALGLVVWWLYDTGYDNGAAAVRTEWDAANAKQRKAEADQANAASTKLETGNAQAKVVYRTITRTVDKVVDRPVYRNVCIDADGLQLANAALRGALTPAGKPDGAVPGSDAARGGDRSGGAAEDR